MNSTKDSISSGLLVIGTNSGAHYQPNGCRKLSLMGNAVEISLDSTVPHCATKLES